ncbi:MAG: DUF2218 domain-containing protein [Pseudomonadota bacterium]
MAQFSAHISTTRGPRYIEQICTHFGQAEAICDTGNFCRINLQLGQCQLSASNAALRVSMEASTTAIGKLKSLIGNHLERFAFRDIHAVIWHQFTTPKT